MCVREIPHQQAVSVRDFRVEEITYSFHTEERTSKSYMGS